MGNNCSSVGCADNTQPLQASEMDPLEQLDQKKAKSNIIFQNGIKTQITKFDPNDDTNTQISDKFNTKGNRVLMYVKELPTKLTQDSLRNNQDQNYLVSSKVNNRDSRTSSQNSNLMKNKFGFHENSNPERNILSKSTAGRFLNISKKNHIFEKSLNKKNLRIFSPLNNENQKINNSINNNGIIYMNGKDTNNPIKNTNKIKIKNIIFSRTGIKNNINNTNLCSGESEKKDCLRNTINSEIDYSKELTKSKKTDILEGQEALCMNSFKNKNQENNNKNGIINENEKVDLLTKSGKKIDFNLSTFTMISPEKYKDLEKKNNIKITNIFVNKIDNRIHNFSKKLLIKKENKDKNVESRDIKIDNDKKTFEYLKFENIIPLNKNKIFDSLNNESIQENSPYFLKHAKLEKPEDILLTCANSLIDDAEKSVLKIDDFEDKKLIIEKKKEEEKKFIHKIKNKEKKSYSNKNNISSLYSKENKNLMKVFSSTSKNEIAINCCSNNSMALQNVHSKERYGSYKRKNYNFSNTANGFKSPQYVNSNGLENPFSCDKKTVENSKKRPLWKVNPNIFQDERIIEFMRDPFNNYHY